MKTPDNSLHALIESLDSGEKRYFRQRSQAAGTGGGHEYLRLFDVLDRQKTYDDLAARKALSHSPGDWRFPVAKRYLQDRIADALRAYHADAFPEEAVLRELQLARILLRKGRRLLAAKALARADLLIARIDALGLEPMRAEVARSLAMASTPPDDHDLLEIGKRLEAAMLRQKEENRQRIHAESLIREHYRHVHARDSEAKERVERHWRELEKTPAEHAPSWRARLARARAEATWHHMEGRPVEAARVNTSVLELLDAHPALRNRHAEIYLSTLSNLLIDLFGQGRYEEVAKGTGRLRRLNRLAVFRKLPGFTLRVFRQGYLLELNRAVAAHRYGDGWSAREEVTSGMRRFGERLGNNHIITLHYLLGWCGAVEGEADNALDHVRLILNRPEPPAVRELLRYSALLQLLLHTQLGNDRLLDSLLPNTRRRLQAERVLSAPESVLFRNLGRWLRAGLGDRRTVLEDWKKECQQQQNTSAWQAFFQSMDLRDWLDRRIEGS